MDRLEEAMTGSEQAPWWPGLWRSLDSLQQPDWTGPELSRIVRLLAALPPLVAPADVSTLRHQLREVQAGRAFVLQGGDCAEHLGRRAVLDAQAKYRLLGRMAATISERTGLPVVTIGRLAGQFAKPRSRPVEEVGGRLLPAFQGLLVNGPEATDAARAPRPGRLVEAYATARDVLELLARLAGPGSTRASAVPVNNWLGARGWSADPVPLSAEGAAYGRTSRVRDQWIHRGLWASHEALILDYEEPLARRDPETGEWYLSSAHLPWVGYRSNHPNGGHVRFLAELSNPVAVKVGPDTDPADLIQLCHRLDPKRTPGRLTLVSRQGAALLRSRLPRLVAAVRDAGHPVIWMCDPMHGNTVRTASGLKTRHYDDIAAELSGFFEVLTGMGQLPGGVHLELAADDVTECVGGGGPQLADLPTAYRTLCDPRLNDVQAVALTELTADLLRTPGAGRMPVLTAAAR
ncbi:3-deoxy-7-phosphoheptulonate synthase [Actinoplanes sp. NPDC051411]|uniref:3-deoxy-7-phosphoheptulonate synthase n=1 Tax=Actinoplanes sp. NPDC051411 TaxID=3155522 RepID=UPI0034269F05